MTVGQNPLVTSGDQVLNPTGVTPFTWADVFVGTHSHDGRLMLTDWASAAIGDP